MTNKAEMPNSAGNAESPSMLAQQIAGCAQQIAEDVPLETSEHEARAYAPGDGLAGQVVDADWTPLGDLVSRFPEINLGNYGDEEVRALQEWAFEAVDALNVAGAKVEPPAGTVPTDEQILAVRRQIAQRFNSIQNVTARTAVLFAREVLALASEPPAVADDLSAAARDVLAERRRQRGVEGFTDQHDDQYTAGQLTMAALTYLEWMHGEYTPGHIPINWPWSTKWFKPTYDSRRLLEKVGALIFAEIERLDRAAAKGGAQ